jgi:quinol monooxygenase YgiN
MFGTVARVAVQPGKEREFLAIGEQWTKERGEATGQVAEYVFKADGRDGEHYLVAVFRDREAYYANAADPETDRWHRRLRATLAADPEWHDGEIVQSMQFGGI